MSATLRLTRQGAGIELRRGRFEVVLDGESISPIDYHDNVEGPLSPGVHSLRISAGRYSSRTRSFEVADGDVVNFRCHGAMVWPRYLVSIVKPSLAIALKRQ